MKFFNQAEGYIAPDGAGGYDYVYQYKDHLGNVRLSYSDSNGDGVVDVSEIIEESNYYPFGLKHRGYNDVVNGMEHPHKYQGQELTENFDYNMYEFELRHYDPALGRFITTDPYEQFHSPYLAMGNNPVVSFDPDGGYCYDTNGNQIACPEDELHDEFRDNKDNHITVLDGVVVTPSEEDTAETVETEEPEIVKGDKFIDVDAEAMLATILLIARTTSQLDGKKLGPADMAAAGQVLTGLALISAILQLEDFVNRNQATIEQVVNSKYIPAPKTLPGFPGAVKAKRKNGRARWHLPNGDIGEWDSQHGEVEVYDKTGKKHKGGYDPDTGKKKSKRKPGRKTDKK